MKRKSLLSSTIESSNESIKRIKRDQGKLRAHRAQISEFDRRLRTKHPNTHRWLSVGWESKPESVGSGGAETITLSMSMHDLDGLKSKQLCDVLERLVDADAVETKDYASSLNRDYEFWFRLPDIWMRVRICAYVRSDSPTCRKVLVGTEERVVREEKFEIVCN